MKIKSRMNKKAAIEPLFLNVAYLLIMAGLFLTTYFIIANSSDNQLNKAQVESKELALIIDIGYNSEDQEEFILDLSEADFDSVINFDKGQTEIKISEAIPAIYNHRFFKNSEKTSQLNENEIKIS